MAKVYFVRHGKSQANTDGVVTGWLDSPLTKEGIDGAYSLAAKIRKDGTKFDKIYSSSLSRAHDTARIIAEAVGYDPQEIIILSDLREKGNGEFEGQPHEHLFNANEEEIIAAKGESFDEFRQRVLRAANDIYEDAEEAETLLIVSHSAVYKMAQTIQAGLDAGEYRRFPVPGNTELLLFPSWHR